MALRALMARKELDEANKSLESLREKMAGFETREAELEQAIAEAETDEEKAAVEEAVGDFEIEKAEAEKEVANLEERVSTIEAELSEMEEKQAPVEEPNQVERTKEVAMETRKKFFGLNHQERDAIFAREDVTNFLAEVRTAIQEKRALTNAGLLIPEVFIGLIRENLADYSKLYKHVNVRQVSGKGRAVVEGTIPEAVWTDACANLNELSLTFNDVEVDGWMVGGYFAVCNANIEDSDIDLATELLTVIGQSIGIAIDKAILYGTGTRMPLGVVTRLAQTTKPSDYPDTARTWVDLHTSNVKTISDDVTGKDFVKAIVAAFGPAKGKYSRGEKVFCMNDATYSALLAECVEVDASGAIVAGVNGSMPVLGGAIEVLEFIPDNTIVAGYFDLYLLAERAGIELANSEHAMFIQNKTVYKGTARYDGQPAIAEGFVAIGINGTTPSASVTFAPDSANTPEEDGE